MLFRRFLPTLFCGVSCLLTVRAAPLGVFDFNLRGADPAAQIHSLDGIGFDGIAMFLNTDADLARLAAYQKAKPDLRLIAGLVVVDHEKSLDEVQLGKVIHQLGTMKAKVWLILKGKRTDEASIVGTIRKVADLAAAEHIGVSLYPHDGEVHSYRTAEEALVFLKKADRPNLTLSVHLCHELRAGNGGRLDEVVNAVRPYLDLVTICGARLNYTPNNPDWSDAIRPLADSDYDVRLFLRALRNAKFDGEVILHTFGLMKQPASHYRESFMAYQKRFSEVAHESAPASE